MLLREKMEREKLATQEKWGARVPTELIPAFSLGAPESDSEDSSAVGSDVPASEYSDAESADVPPSPQAQESTWRLALEDTWGPDVPQIPDEDPGRSYSVERQSSGSPVAQPHQPPPQKHVSFSDLLPLHHEKTPLNLSRLTGQPRRSNLSSPATSPGSSSSSLKTLGGTPAVGKRSHSAVNLRGLTEGLSHFSLGETDPRRMRKVDAILANEMVFGGFNKERGRSKERS